MGLDVATVDQLFRRHWRDVWRAAYALTSRRELANDVAQEAFVRAVTHGDRFDSARPFRPWVTKIAVNLALDELRRERRLGPGLPDARSEAPPEADDAVLRAVTRLAPDRRVVVVLHYWLDFSTPEIAQVLDVPQGTVASRLSRALDQLRTDLEAEHV
jgi:RNA polymerase sigma-70 factor (ECF subfamily)